MEQVLKDNNIELSGRNWSVNDFEREMGNIKNVLGESEYSKLMNSRSERDQLVKQIAAELNGEEAAPEKRPSRMPAVLPITPEKYAMPVSPVEREEPVLMNIEPLVSPIEQEEPVLMNIEPLVSPAEQVEPAEQDEPVEQDEQETIIDIKRLNNIPIDKSEDLNIMNDLNIFEEATSKINMYIKAAIGAAILVVILSITIGAIAGFVKGIAVVVIIAGIIWLYKDNITGMITSRMRQ